MIKHKRQALTYTQLIALSFLGIIVVGSILLALPVSARDGNPTPFLDAMFTATSATCVTGLIVRDTFTHWSVFGQVVILTLMQFGGLGFMTIITMFSLFLKRRISLHERRLLMQSAGNMRISGIVRLIKNIIIGTFIFEALGTVLLTFRFCPMYGVEGIFYAVFHSVAAFCNAGFDLMGRHDEFSSLTMFVDDYLVNLTLIFLIVTGGIGFMVWNDILKHKLKFSEYELHSKIVISSTAALLVTGTVLFCLFEKDNLLAEVDFSEKVLISLFQVVSPRTAGFNTVDMASLSESSKALIILLMFIGGSPGSTAGGIKTTTLVVILLSAAAASRRSDSITIFKRRIDDDTIKQASAIASVYIAAIFVSVITICTIQPLDLVDVVFEVVSAVSTTGLTTGITTRLGSVSKLIIMTLMFAGRVGGLSLMLVLAEKRTNIPLDRPVEKILIG